MTQRRYFGTDGVRGPVGKSPLTADFALRLANAAARVLTPDGGTVLIGKDTRLSGYMFESALEAGFVAAGVDALLIGPLPTPGIAYMAKYLECDFGVVISASHNRYDDNGIKFFGKNGEKISDELELAIEALLDEPPVTLVSRSLGRASRVDKMRTKYQDFCRSTLPEGMSLDGFRLVVDCANGAGYKVAPRVFADLGADVVPIGTSPNGRNINEGCGSTMPELLQHLVPGVKADAGIALDGDGDRIVMVDSTGTIVDGDQILFILANERLASGMLEGPVVGTVMSNLGLEQAITALGVPFLRAKVGDRYVLEMLRKEGGTLGGEPSGHVLMLDKTTTGDAIVVALQVLAAMKRTGKTLAELAEGMPRFPQVLLNVRLEEKFDPESSVSLQEEMANVTKELGTTGRIVLRASGTEPLVRVMVEAEDSNVAESAAQRLAAAVRAAAV